MEGILTNARIFAMKISITQRCFIKDLEEELVRIVIAPVKHAMQVPILTVILVKLLHFCTIIDVWILVQMDLLETKLPVHVNHAMLHVKHVKERTVEILAFLVRQM
jgi:ABC-type uncharacterized transport system permease subunit